MMIQTDVTSDSSLLRATCENRLSPSLCQSGLCRTEVRAQCSRWPAFAVIVKSCDMQSESAIAGDRRIKACWVALHAFSRAASTLKSLASCESAALRAVSTVANHTMILSGLFQTPHCADRPRDAAPFHSRKRAKPIRSPCYQVEQERYRAARCSVRACRSDPVPPHSVDARVAAAQSSLIMLQPQKEGSMI